jgi:hypothetical protein
MGKKRDVVGEVYNRLTIIGEAPTRVSESGLKYKRVYTKCECGKRCENSYRDLTKGKIKSCGCIKPPVIKVFPGEQYNLWTVLEGAYSYKDKSGNYARRVLVKCICGKEKFRDLNTIVSGKSKSCGCRGIIKQEKINWPPPTNTLEEKWVKLLDLDTQWVSTKARRYLQSTGMYYNIKMESNYLQLQKGWIWWANAIYKSFYGPWDNTIQKLVLLDNNVENINLDNLMVATRVKAKGKPDWLTYLYNNTKRSEKLGEISKRKILELYEKQNGKSYFLGLPMDITCTNKLAAISVDRLDNSKGYTDDNVVLNTRFENIGRGNASEGDMFKLASAILGQN